MGLINKTYLTIGSLLTSSIGGLINKTLLYVASLDSDLAWYCLLTSKGQRVKVSIIEIKKRFAVSGNPTNLKHEEVLTVLCNFEGK